MSNQKAKDAFATALLVFFLGVALFGLYLLGRGDTSNLAIGAAVFGIIGDLLSLILVVWSSTEGG